MLLAVKSFEMFPKHNGYDFIFRLFLLCIDTFLLHEQMKNCCFHYNEEFKQNRFCNLEKLIEYSASAVIFVSSNLCVGPLPRTIYLIHRH